MSAFKLRGFPDSPQNPEVQSTEEAPKQEETQDKPKKRGPYKKRDKAAETLAAMTPLDRLEYALKDLPGGPSRIQLDEWKDRHGNYYFSSVDKQNIFIWKTLKRTEYKNVLVSGALEKPGSLEEFVVRRCLLWPKPDQDFMSNSDAGIINTLFKQVYYQSGFIPDDEALNMIEKI